ncbi:Carbonic anhydrase 2 [Wickerhamomyces ciferrii]|uniref:Carbonic anhydrase n=1 Tax=Wickerhamomyces ciferrii (strain ATCC 14091 / BCRC 22168 / CBS 111 / JCM 3599 / NBRC 0793 / NRRL Y-1031 F-60-10) TaxID=1206466 RepID=K0KKU6_WICCF|nr:Carbonic anhydrase 2 [Wickerhamomyces ciferrii]CCH43636.1 Carbonic anhydrase 2 [Wickerhamomyces ciferrii]
MLKQEQLSTSPISYHDHAGHDHHHSHSHGDFDHEESPFTLNKESNLKDYLYNNRLWAEKMNETKPGLFESNGKGQNPHTLWIGCSDSRYNETVLNISPGEVFTFKNIANMISIDDLTTVSTLEFSINVLKVKKIIICGHTDCGGIWNSLSYNDLGPTNSNLQNYLKQIDELRDLKINELNEISNLKLRAKKLAEFNVLKQLDILKRQKPVINAVAKGELEIWGLMYNVDSGFLEVIEQ